MENKGRLLGWNAEIINVDKAGEVRCRVTEAVLRILLFILEAIRKC